MKTVGQLLHSDRIKKNISIEELSLATKIDGKYIEALEADRYDLLPSETFAKGFIRNLSLSLGSDPEEFIAVFRRDYRDPNLKKKNISSPHKHSSLKLHFLSSQLIPIIFGVVVFAIYLIFQFRVILTPPSLSLSKPSKDAVLTSPIDIEGTTSTDSLVTINEDNVVKPDQNGVFKIRLSLPVGETILKIKATNRFGRSQFTEIPLTVISN
ncbi:MAG TPA: helix-turn-helix domain-containing protein [Spirochaetia bacterium]|nr:helix-turn-helix domain-containing protein [Spirochaetia bacterium]